ncbi:MAG: sensor histidine kinase [Sandaracinaceae bacterium]|nr:sensor histidine kinase [Sandaracinaceae bacterium]
MPSPVDSPTPLKNVTDSTKTKLTGLDDRDAIAKAIRKQITPLLWLWAFLLSAAPPLAFYVVEMRELRERASSLATEAAQVLARIAEEQPVLWRYDLIKIVDHLRHFQSRVDLVRIDVIDEEGIPIDENAKKPPQGPWIWTHAPLVVGGEEVGAVWVASTPSRVRREALNLLALFGMLSAVLASLVHRVALRNAQKAESRIAELIHQLAERNAEERVHGLRLAALALQEEERKGIARDLHDSVAQALAAIRIQAEVLKSQALMSGGLSSEHLPHFVRGIEGISTQVELAIEELRRSIARLRPAVLDDLGLTGAINHLMEHLQLKKLLDVHCEITIKERLPTTVETALYRIVQEAMTNVARHARGAKTLWITIIEKNNHINLTIEDDGDFEMGDGDSPNKWSGHGLGGMRERAEILGGKVEIGTRHPKGLRICVEIPSRHHLISPSHAPS